MNDHPALPKIPRTQYGRVDDAVFVAIQCVAESHADRPWLVACFYRGERGDTGEPFWGESNRYYRDGEAVAKIPKMSRVYLIGDTPKTEEDFASDITRSRFRFTCEICGIDRPYRAEKISPFFDRLAASGVSEVSLEALVRTLR